MKYLKKLYRLSRKYAINNNLLLGAIFYTFVRYYRLRRPAGKGALIFDCKNLFPISFQSRFLLKNYEYEDLVLAERYVKPEDEVLELGGSIGVLSCYTNDLLRSDTRHVVVEANPRLINSLKRNAKLNSANFKLYNAVVGSGWGTQKSVGFYTYDLPLAGSTVKKTKHRNTKHLKTERLTDVNTIELGTMLEEFLGRDIVLQMDIEGGEYNFLNSAGTRLRDFRLIIFELHPAFLEVSVDQIHDLLKSVGFSFKDKLDSTEVWERLATTI